MSMSLGAPAAADRWRLPCARAAAVTYAEFMQIGNLKIVLSSPYRAGNDPSIWLRSLVVHDLEFVSAARGGTKQDKSAEKF